MLAFADAIESIAWRNHPCIACRPFQFAPEIFEHCRVLRSHCGEVIERLIDAGSQAGGGDVMSEYSPIYHLREERRLRNQFAQQVWNILLPIGHKGLFLPGTAAEGDHHNFFL